MFKSAENETDLCSDNSDYDDDDSSNDDRHDDNGDDFDEVAHWQVSL